jgi:hypothetical protein
MQRTKTLVLGDTHCNNTFGLCAPRVPLDDGGSYRPSPFQRALWTAWLDMAATVKEASIGCELVVVLNGDIVEMDAKKRSTQTITRNRSTINRLTIDALEPILQLATRIYVVRGTEAHVGNSGEAEETLAADIGAVKDDETGMSSHWQLKRIFGGARFDIAHHASMGGLPWTEKNAANKLAAIAEVEYLRSGLKPPDFVLRSHVHRVSDSSLNFAPMRALTLPCWTGHTSYIHRIGGSNKLPDIGAFLFDEKTLIPLRYDFKKSQKGWQTG